MPIHPHERIAQEVWRAVSTSNIEDIGRLFHKDMLWHASGRGSKSGVYEGRDAVINYLATLGEDAEVFDSELVDVLVGEHHTALVSRVTGERGAIQLDTGFVFLMRIEGDSVAEIWAIPRDQYAIDEFWSA